MLIGGRSIAEVCRLAIADAPTSSTTVDFTARERQIAERVIKEINARLGFLLDVGLDYLSLDRPAGTLSGGEAQRIRLATQIGSGLVGVLYVLDEPSIGLHQRDNHRLIETLTRLRDLGNTLIVVEHDEDTIATADWVVDIGPGAGEHGGQVVHSGTVEGLLEHPDSLTGKYLSGRREIPVPEVRRPQEKGRQVTVVGAREHNLDNVSVSFPLGNLVAVTGVSGSGKSTLVNDILYNVLANKLNGARQVPGRHKTVTGLEHLDKVVHVDQSPIGRTPRSNPATYTGVFDHVRKLFATTTEAKVRGYQPGRFSFNVKGGRCEACSGDGTIKIEMNFLPDVYVPCEVCHGARYNRETLEVHFKGKTVADVLDMPIEEAADFFAAVPAIARHMQHAQRGRPGLRPARPARAHAVRRRGAARQARHRAAEALAPAAPSTCSTSRPPACTSRTSASCSACCRAWSTRATRSSSSSTTSTSSRAPTGSSTSVPRAAAAVAGSSPRAPPSRSPRSSTRTPAGSSPRSWPARRARRRTASRASARRKAPATAAAEDRRRRDRRQADDRRRRPARRPRPQEVADASGA